LGVAGVHAALYDRLRLISGGRGPDHRHHSLGTVIGWSLDLLDDEERVLFRRLGMFVGGFDLDAITALNPEFGVGAVADLVGRLVDRSLVVHRRTGAGARWSLLATVRAVAERELAASGEDIRPQHPPGHHRAENVPAVWPDRPVRRRLHPGRHPLGRLAARHHGRRRAGAVRAARGLAILRSGDRGPGPRRAR
jgi:predicted ATPase